MGLVFGLEMERKGKGRQRKGGRKEGRKEGRKSGRSEEEKKKVASTFY